MGAPAAVAFDPFEAGFTDSPYEQYARLRSADPVHRSELVSAWVLTRYADVSRVLRDPSISVEIDNATPSPPVEAERAQMAENGRKADTLVLRDDPDHVWLRRLLQKPFAPRAIEGLRAMVAARVDALFDVLVERDEMDVVADLAYPLPVAVFCEMLGIPDEASPLFRTWTSAVARNLDPVVGADERRENFALLHDMEEYLLEWADEKRRRPTDDILSVLVQAEEDGDRLSREQLVAQLVTLYVAGHEPTTSLIGNGLLALLQHPAELARLRGDLSLLPGAINELLRYDGPNQFVRRFATTRFELGDAVVEPGDTIYCGVGAANRDPERWGDDADAVRVERLDSVHHLQFGTGVHACLGSHLARLQAELVFAALFTRLGDIVFSGAPVRSRRMVLRGLDCLPIAFASRER